MARRIKIVPKLLNWSFLLSILALGLGIFLAPWLPLSILPWLQVLSPLLALLGLFYFLYLIVFLFQKRWLWAFICSVYLLLSGLIFSQNIRSQSQPLVEAPDHFTVLSYNLGAFRLNEHKVKKTLILIKELNPDIIAFQEFRNVKFEGKAKAIQYFAEALDLPHYHFLHLDKHIHGIAVFSRFPILGNDTLYLPDDEINSGMISTIQTPQGKISFANLHMSSFQFKTVLRRADDPFGKTLVFMRQIKRTLLRQERKFEQVFSVLDASKYPVILAGDFNAPSHSRLSYQYRNRLADAFLTAGQGYGWTYPLKRPDGNWGMRLDYLYYSSEVDALGCKRIARSVSDHYPLLGTFRLIGQPSP